MLNKQLLIITVSQLNKQVKHYLENEIGLVHVEGEISNLTKPSSGHLYFILKDGSAQIRCVFFKNQSRQMLAKPLKDGQKIVASGRLSLYEARGDYQLIVEQCREAGLGALYQVFEELKQKLAAEGLFNPLRKKSLPPLPKTIGIISSSTGAALQDILSTLGRRFPQAHVLLFPSEVQGINAAAQLIRALQFAHSDKRCDVLIVARGGGSIEDLWAFNDEHLVREIANSAIPIISGVGHETDFTLVDFAADYRAETPTAAAIAASPDCTLLLNSIDKMHVTLVSLIHRLKETLQVRLIHLIERISSPRKTIQSQCQRLDYLERRLLSSFTEMLNKKNHALHLCLVQLNGSNPKTKLTQQNLRLKELTISLQQELDTQLKHHRYQLNTQLSTLHAVSPLATLDRGYAIASKNNQVLYSIEGLVIGDAIDIRLAKGLLACEVVHIKE